MKSVIQQAVSNISQYSARYRNSAISLSLMLAIGLVISASYTPLKTRFPLISLPNHSETQAPSDLANDSQDNLLDNPPALEYKIQEGDTLSGLFERFNLSQKVMYQILESDLDVLALDTLKPGNRLRFWLDETNQKLTKLELYFNPAQQVIFTRVDDDNFTYEEINLLGEWQLVPIRGEIQGSFFLSAQKAGLSAAEVQKIESLFEEKINFSRDVRAGDQFEVLRNEQYIGKKLSGNSEIIGIRFKGKHELAAFLFEDGRYYDKQGKSLTRAFTRYPVSKQYRISSGFNPRRKHPITGLIRPHNGTDFATPTGTPVMTTGDGVVRAVRNHPYAGKYVVIEHGGKYRTRYLHLSKILVKKGQRVTRGQRIGLSGRTGRVTGPHLHYEFHINLRPVNPMRAEIPLASEVPNSKMAVFKRRIDEFNHKMRG